MSAQQAAEAVRSGASYVASQLGVGSVPEPHQIELNSQGLAGSGPNVPQNTVDSTATTNVSFENRPKTLPKSEIEEREQERGLQSSSQGGVPGQVLSSQREAHWGTETAGNPETVLEKRDFENELKSKVLETRPVGKGREQAYFLDQPDTLDSHRDIGFTRQGGSFAADTTVALSAASQVGSSATQITGMTSAGENYPSVGTEQQTPLGSSGREQVTSRAASGSRNIGDVSSGQATSTTAKRSQLDYSTDPVTLHEQSLPETSTRSQASTRTGGSYQDSSIALGNAQAGPSLSNQDSDAVLGTVPSQGGTSNQRNTADLGKVGSGAGRTDQESDTVLGTAPTPQDSDKVNVSQEGQTGQHSENKMSHPNDPYWHGKETAREHLDHQAREGKGTQENVGAIPTAGGQRLGEKHWGESKKLD